VICLSVGVILIQFMTYGFQCHS